MSTGIGLTASLHMAARSLTAQQRAIEVTGHNLANINTPGAARQRLDFRPDVALQFAGNGVLQGVGVYIQRIESVRSSLLDSQVLRQQSLSGLHSEVASLGRLLEQTLGENFTTSQLNSVPGIQSLTGVQNSLNNFFDSWNSLANDPTSTIARTQVITRGQALAADISSAYARVVEAKADIFPAASQAAANVNSLAKQIASLNEQISRAEIATGQSANDLRDQRQLALEELARHVNITVQTSPVNSSMIDVHLADNNAYRLVSGIYGGGEDDPGDSAPTSWALEVSANYNPTTNSSLQFQVTSQTGGTALLATTAPSGGTLGGMLRVANSVIGSGLTPSDDTLTGRLQQLASSLSTAVNGLHNSTTSWDPSGNNGGVFFTGTAANLTVAITDPALLAAAGGVSFPGSLDNSVARAIADLRSSPALGEYHRQTVAGLGLEVQQAMRNDRAQQLVSAQINKERESISGISIDEEMTNLVTYQRAYEASARLISVLDRMMETVTNLVR